MSEGNHVRRFDENEPALLEMAARLSRAIAEAEVERRSGTVVTVTRFSRGRVRRVGNGVAFVFGDGRPLGALLKEGFLNARNEIY